MATKASQELQTLVTSFEADDTKFEEKGNSQAGKRARATLIDIKKLCDTRRKEIQAKKNADKAA